jgi:hypothetical protein
MTVMPGEETLERVTYVPLPVGDTVMLLPKGVSAVKV